MKISSSLAFLLLLVFTTSACEKESSSLEDDVVEEATDYVAEVEEAMTSARVYFSAPTNGDTIAATSNFVMGFEGVKIVTAGIMEEGTGHFHVLINTPFIDAGQAIPSDETHRHFGTAATEAELTLPTGTHTIRLQLGDGAHRGLEGDGYRDEITVTVE